MREMRSAFGATAADLVENDDRVAVVLAEISTDYFADPLRRHPARVVNIGIMEQAMVGVAAGFAMEGFPRSRTPCRPSWPSGRMSS
jgi:transketolase